MMTGLSAGLDSKKIQPLVSDLAARVQQLAYTSQHIARERKKAAEDAARLQAISELSS